MQKTSAAYDVVLDICRRLRTAGGRALLVGGCVRDQLSGLPVTDYDVEVHGLSVDAVRQTLEAAYPLDAVGASFGVFKVQHYPVDIALPRTENKTGRGHRGFMITPRSDLSFAEAAARRDFTVNAVMFDPLNGEYLDPWHGREDWQKGILRHVSSHFAEDPLRVLRGMQFVGRFGLIPAPETLEICRGIDQSELPRERLLGEWEKLLLQGKYFCKALDFLRGADWLRFYPALSALSAEELNAAGRSLELEAAAREQNTTPADLTVSAALLLHKIASGAARQEFMAQLWNSRDFTKQVSALLENRHFPGEILADGSLRRLSLRVPLPALARVYQFTSGNGVYPADFERRAAALGVWEHPPVPLLAGRHLTTLGIAPGPAMGKILNAVFEAQLEGKIQTLDDALALAKTFR